MTHDFVLLIVARIRKKESGSITLFYWQKADMI